jgi:hypothetical protein
MKVRELLELFPSEDPIRRPSAWQPPVRMWIECGECKRGRSVCRSATVIDEATGERLWTCGDCKLDPEARQRKVDRRLGITR